MRNDRVMPDRIADAAMRVLDVPAADRRGDERDVSWVGSSILGSDGWPVSPPEPGNCPRVRVAEVDPNAARDKRIWAADHLSDDRCPSL